MSTLTLLGNIQGPEGPEGPDGPPGPRGPEGPAGDRDLNGGNATTGGTDPYRKVRPRRDTAANWAATNPVLLTGEVGWETDTGLAKMGDGATAWNVLPYSVKRLPFINLLEEGVVADGTADDAPALTTAVAKAKAEKRALWLPAGKAGMRLNSTVDARYIDVTFDSPIRIGQTSGPGIILGDTSVQANRRDISWTSATNLTANPPNPSVRLTGLKKTRMTVGTTDYLQLHADANDTTRASLAYCKFDLDGGYIAKLEFLGENGVAWINDNKFFGGRLKTIIIDGSYFHNGNKWFGPTIENADIQVRVGSDNLFDKVRTEGTSTISFGQGTWNNGAETSFTSNPASRNSNLTVTSDLGTDNFVTSGMSARLRSFALMRYDASAKVTDLASEYPKITTPVPGLSKLRLRQANSDVFDSGIFALEQNAEATYATPEEVAIRIGRLQLSSDVKMWRPRVYCYDANKQLLDPTVSGKQYINATGGWTANASGYYGFGATVSAARILVMDPAVKYLRIALSSSSSAGTAFEYVGITGFWKQPQTEDLALAIKRSVQRPLTQATPPVEGAFNVGERVAATGGGGFQCTARVETTLTAAASSAATSLSAASITGLADGDVIGVLLADGTTHWTTITGAPTAGTINITSGLASAANSGATIVTSRWALSGVKTIVRTYTSPIGSDITWTKPQGLVGVTVLAIGGGAGGGAGRQGAASTARYGGGGGGGAVKTIGFLPAAILGTTEVVRVGIGGAGGASQTAADTDGAVGVSGGNSYFGDPARGRIYAPSGTNGGGGTAAAGVAGGGGTAGGASSITAAAGAGSNALVDNVAPGGGAGGGIDASNNARAGGVGGANRILLGSTATVAVGSTPTAGTTGTAQTGQGGPGSSASTTTAPTPGTDGALYGAGGGGGGASANGNASGAGGNGAPGIVIVVEHY